MPSKQPFGVAASYHCGAEQYWQREIGCISPRKFARTVGGSLDLIQRLKLHDKLEGHDGCVNTVAFNSTGELLLSGSDDRQIILWEWEAGTQRTSYYSGHENNVFQARSMPFSNDRTIVSCAADGQVRVGQLAQDGTCETRRLARHRGRAHKLALEPGSGTTFFSCGEDGVVRHFDLRESRNLKLFTCGALMSGRDSGRSRRRSSHVVGLNSIVVNPRDPHQFAVGGADEYARVYDFRSVVASPDLDKPVACYAPEHLRGDSRTAHITCVAFSQQGELLVSYNDELIYLFQEDMALGQTPPPTPTKNTEAESVESGAGSKRDSENDEVEEEAESSSQEPQQYKGHRNAKTIKGVNFFGPNSEYVVSGSDCGRIFIWQKIGGRLVALLYGDSQVVNCLEPHPSATILATSGIESDVKIWTPTAEKIQALPTDAEKVMAMNERRREERNGSISLTPEVLMHLLRLQRRAAELDEMRNPFFSLDSSSAPAESSDEESAHGSDSDEPAEERRRNPRARGGRSDCIVQ